MRLLDFKAHGASGHIARVARYAFVIALGALNGALRTGGIFSCTPDNILGHVCDDR